MAEPMLAVEALTKRFGGVVASDAISLEIAPGELHAIIGPNGAGKTTLVGELTGEVTPDGGTIRFAGRDITALPVYRRSQLGLARSFQITSLFARFHRARQCGAGRAGACRPSFRFWPSAARRSGIARAGARRWSRRPRRARRCAGRRSQPRRASPARDRHGAGDQAADAAARRADGRHGAEESPAWSSMLRALKGGVAILLIEHDMDAVFALADRISVLVYGRIIASGDAATIRADPAVRRPISASARRRRMLTPSRRAAPGIARGGNALRPEPRPVRRLACCRAGRARLADGPQRHGQDHDRALDHGTDAGGRRLDPLRRQ